MTSGVYWVYQVSKDRAVYVGSSARMEQRFSCHISQLAHETHCNKYLQRVWNKYGPNDLKFMQLEACPTGILAAREQFWMDALSPVCNAAPAAGSTLGFKADRSTRQKMSQVRRGVPKAAAHKAKIGAAHIGMKRSEATCHNISAAKQGKKLGPMPDEQRRKLSDALRNSPKAKAQRQQAAESRRGKPGATRGHKFSDEQRQRVSDAVRAWWQRRKEQAGE